MAVISPIIPADMKVCETFPFAFTWVLLAGGGGGDDALGDAD